MKEVKFELNKKAFKGPFRCCNKQTVKKSKKVALEDIEFSYEVWQCSKCKKEYLDSDQAKRMERFWTIEKLLKDNLISMERSMNYDGKAYFFRFPKELSKNFTKESCVEIKVIDPETFLVEIKP